MVQRVAAGHAEIPELPGDAEGCAPAEHLGSWIMDGLSGGEGAIQAAFGSGGSRNS